MSTQQSAPPRWRRVFVFSAVAIVIGLAAVAAAANDGFLSPLLIPAAEFEASGVESFGTLDRFAESGGYIISVPDELTCIMAPVYLPNGATITRFEAAVADLINYDPDSSYTCPRFYPDVEVALISNQIDDNAYPEDSLVIVHASVSSTSNYGNVHIVADSTINYPFVNNIQMFYWVRVYLCGQFQLFQGVRIYYRE